MFLSMESHDTWKFSFRVSDNAVGYEFSVNESTILVMEEGRHHRGKEKGEEKKITSRILEKVIKNYVILYVFKMIHHICVHTNYICIKYL